MGRQLIFVSTIALSLVITGLGYAQGGNGHHGNKDFRGHGGGPGPGGGGPGSGPGINGPPTNARERAERFQRYQLSPEERQVFQRNAERWLRMSPEQQMMLRERERVRRQQMKVEADAALRQSGLRLDQNAHDQFEARYLQERRRMERQLRQEAEAKRQQQLSQLNERLKSEFQPQQGSPAVSPTTSGKK